MAYHSINIIRQYEGAVAAATYRNGGKMINDYAGIVRGYTRKNETIHIKILLSPHAPSAISAAIPCGNRLRKNKQRAAYKGNWNCYTKNIIP